MKSLIDNNYYTALIIFLLVVLAGNIPVGILRRRFPKFSRPWARCIYLPILFNIIFRRLLGLTYKVIPLTILALFVGQFIGTKLNVEKRERLEG